MRNLYRVLLTPWIASPRSSRGLVVIALAMALAGAITVSIYGHVANPWILSALVLGAGNALCWFLLMPNCLFLLLAARRLGMPGITGDILWSMPLYAALTIGLPMLLHLPPGHVLAFAVVQLSVAAIGMLYMLLPAYIGVLLCLLPALHAFTRHLAALSGFERALPGIDDPRFVSWGGGFAVVLILLLAWRWQQLLHGEIPTGGWRAPGLLNMRRHRGRSQSDPLTDATLLRRRPTWMIARVDLSDVGVGAPVKSLRVALGGTYLPQTMVGRLYQLASTLLALLVVGLLLFALTLGDQRGDVFLHYLSSRAGFTLEGWMFGVFSLLAAMLAVEFLLLRWERVNAELPLLALLPGLSGGMDIKRLLLRTAIQRPAAYLGVMLVIGWLAVACLNVRWSNGSTMLLVSLASLGYLCAMTLGIFGGRPMAGSSKGLLLMVMFVLFSLTLLLPLVWQDWPVLSVDDVRTSFGISWLLLALFLWWLGRRGWRALQMRPHPFMPN